MECVIGVVGRDFAVMAADTSAVQSILVHKTDEPGEPGDRVQFTEFIQKNLHLYQFRNNMSLSTAATANFTRGELATALRKEDSTQHRLLQGACLSFRAYDQAAIKFRGVEANINFVLDDYKEDIGKMSMLSKEELVQVLRRQGAGFMRGSSRFRGVTLHKCGKWEARIGQLMGKKFVYLGLYDTEMDAAKSYVQKK